jgi:iron-sulfur cluster assembly protein
VAIREGEAQQSKLSAEHGAKAPGKSCAEAEPAKPKKSKLRPRKAPITMTPKAVEQLQLLFEQPESKFIRVGVKNRGCSGLAYHLEYVDKAGAFDETVEQDGVKVLIDSKALFSIIGSEMDWLEDKLSARFIFKNPNISKSRPLAVLLREPADDYQRNNVDAANPSAFHDEHQKWSGNEHLQAQRRT